MSVVRGQLHETKEGDRSASPVTPHSSLPFPDPSAQPPSFFCLKLLRANPAVKVTGVNELPGKSNYLIGNDPKKWRTNVPTYGSVRYENIYPGVDLVYYGKQGGQLEYDFVVAPGADSRLITLAVASDRQWEGSRQKAAGSGEPSEVSRSPRAESVATNHGPRVTNSAQFKIQNRKSKVPSPLRILTNGDLIVNTTGGDVRFHKPVVYQVQSTVNSSQLTVESKSAGESRQSSVVGDPVQLPTQVRQRTTDHRQRTSDNPNPKIQNPKLVDAHYVLKPGGEVTFEIAPYDRTLPLIIDPVLSYSTYLGGNDMDYANAIAVDASGNAYVTGYTASTNFPLVDPEQSSPGGGTCSDGVDAIACFDAFVTKLNPTGTALVYSTYLGGSNEDYGTSIALDASGDAYVTGYTNSTDFPVQHPLQSKNAGGYDAFVAELSADGASLIYSTYWGGSSDDIGTGVAVDASGNAYLSGYTASPNFPVTSGALRATYGGGNHNGFVVKFNSGGAKLGYSTFLGGSADDYAYGVAVDSAGDAYVTGATNSTNFPTVNAFQPVYAGGLCAVAPNTFPCYDAFVAKLNPAGSALIFSTYLGGTGSDYGYAIALDGSSNAYVTGYTTSTNLPTTAGAFDRVFGGSYDAFVAKLNGAGSTLAYSTYLGGSGTQIGYGVAVDSSGRAFVTGYNYGGYFPTALPLQAQNAGFYDAFVSALNATGSLLVFSTYLGGSSDDFGRGISLDPSGNAYVTGATFSLDFPTTSGSYQPAYEGGPYDAFVTKISLVPSPSLLISPSSYKFANQAVGATSAPQTATLTNVGAAGLMVTGVVASGDFAESDTCVSCSPIAANGACSLSVTFTPTAIGTRTGSLTITNNATIRPQTVTLTGTGLGAAASLSPTTLSFSNQADSTTRAAQTVTLLNAGNTALNVTNVTIAGANSSDFTQANNCGATVATNASCTLSVTFKPTATGSRSGTLTITDNASPATQTVSLTGTGAAAPTVSLSPASLTFSAQLEGTSSSAQSVTLTNTGSVALSITGVTASGDFSQTNSCGSSMAAGASCTASVTFMPTAGGSRAGNLTIADNGVGNPQSVALTGTGEDFTFTAPSGSSTSATVSPGQAASYALSVVGVSGFSQNVTFTCTGAPSGANCALSPSPSTVSSSSTNVTVRVTTTAPSVGAPRPNPLPPMAPLQSWPWLPWIVALAVLGSLGRATRAWVQPGVGRGRAGFVSLVALLLLMAAVAACGGSAGGGGGGNNPLGSSSGTPAGTYTLTATGTFTSGSTVLSHSVNLTLNVT